MYEIRGVLYDIARGLRNDVSIVEDMIKRLSEYGYNMLALNLEYRFSYPSHPAVGLWDSLTQDDIKYLDKIAKERNFELVPFINCAGHNTGIGILEKYKHLSVDSSASDKSVEQLIVGSTEVLEFMKELYSDAMECFSSKYFLIGADEIRQMEKQMPNATEAERIEKVVYHLTEVIEWLKSKGKVPMLFGDMIFKWDIADRLPDGAIIFDWAAFSDPLYKGLSSAKNLNYFKNSGKSTGINPSVITHIGNPVVSVNTTMNIRSYNKEYMEIFGKSTSGVILSVWETMEGTFFSATWPWIYLQSKVFNGTDTSTGMDFIQEYTCKEWGLDTDDLIKWYDLMDVQVQKVLLFNSVVDEKIREKLTPTRNRPNALIRRFFKAIYTSKNILPILHDAGTWLNCKVRKEIKNILQQAETIASNMYNNAKRRKNEPLMLLKWTRVLMQTVDLVELVEELEKQYHEAAVMQDKNMMSFHECINKCIIILKEIASKMEHLEEWIRTLVTYENYSEESEFFIKEAQKNVKWHASLLKEYKYKGRGLVNFNRYIGKGADIVNLVIKNKFNV